MEDEDGIEEAEEISVSILAFFKALSAPGDRARVNDLQQLFIDYRQSAVSLAQAMIDTTLTKDEQSKTMKDVGAGALLLNTELKKFRDISYQNFTQALAESKQAAANAVVVGMLIGGGVSIVLLLTSWGISRAINLNIDKAISTTRRIAEGDWNADIEVGIGDESVMLLAEIKTMRDMLYKHILDDIEEKKKAAQAEEQVLQDEVNRI